MVVSATECESDSPRVVDVGLIATTAPTSSVLPVGRCSSWADIGPIRHYAGRRYRGGNAGACGGPALLAVIEAGGGIAVTVGLRR
jgi:hypothetical protein